MRSLKSIACCPAEATLTMRAGALLDQRQEKAGQQEAGEIVDGKAQLVPVRACLPGRARAAGPDAGIVDQDVEPVGSLSDGVGEPSYLGKRREVRCQEVRGAAAFLDLGDHALASLPVAAVHQNARAGCTEPLGD
jgi:hypothetical protein